MNLRKGKAWKSKYASITYNQISRDFPYGGINEAGLGMEILWLDGTNYGDPKESKKLINESQIIQFVLDTSSNTEEAISAVMEVGIQPMMAKVHYMICDTQNDCRVLEYLNGKRVITNMPEGKERIIQNNTYANTLRRIRAGRGTFRDSNKELEEIFSNNGLLNDEEIVEKQFQNLDRVKQGSFSKWHIVYNLNTQQTWYRKSGGSKIISLNLKDHTFKCKDKKKADTYLISDVKNTGDISEYLEPFQGKMNTELLNNFEGVPDWIKTWGNRYARMNHSCKKK